LRLPADHNHTIRSHPLPIAFILFEETKLLDVAGPLQVFNDAKLPSGDPAYEVQLLSETGGAVKTDTICSLDTRSLDEATTKDWDTILVSGGEAAKAAAQSGPLREALAEVATSCRRFGSICLGAFILAAAGFLAGRTATTHWDGCGELALQFPDVAVDENAIFIEDRGIWTSAGVTAGIDMAIEMIRRDLGAAEALRLAKSLVLPVLRNGGQRQFSAVLAAQSTAQAGRFSKLIVSLLSNLGENHSVHDMARQMGMSERNFSRKFTAETGLSPAQFLERMRVDFAANLLHRADITLCVARQEAGFRSDETMRRAFQRQLGVSPSAYADKFKMP